MEFLNRFVRGLKQRQARSQVLSQTARETGKRGWFPEFGIGEAWRGLTGGDLHEADRNDPTFQENLQNRVDNIVPETNPFLGTLGADDQGVEYKFPDTKQYRTGEYVDKTPSNSRESIEQTKTEVKEGLLNVARAEEAAAKAKERKDWLHKTRNSPAARSGAFTDEQRWQQQLKHREWQKENNRGAYRVKDDPNTPNNEAKEAARAQRFKRRNERLIEKGLRPVNPR